jgi:hypothetical protein
MTTRRAKAKQILRCAQDDNSKSADNADNKKMLTTLTIKSADNSDDSDNLVEG